MTPEPRKPNLTPLVFTVFLDLLGFAMFIPDLQLRGEQLVIGTLHLDKSSVMVGLLVGVGQSVYSIAQLATGTYLGRMSDIKGRRIVLLMSALLSVFAYMLYAHAGTLWLLWLSRALSGVAAANLGVAYAYVADVTTPQERGPKMGLLGAAFGVGFIVGPPLGAQLLKIGHDSPMLLGYFAAGLSLLNLLAIYKWVPESNVNPQPRDKASLVAQIRQAFGVRELAVVLGMFFMMNLAFTNLEATYFRLLGDPNWIFQIPQDKVKSVGSIVLLVVGVAGAITQALIAGKVIPKLGELNTVRIFYTLFIPVFISVPYFQQYWPGLIGTVLLAVTNGLSGPSMSSLVSKNAPSEMQGTIMGLNQSLGSLARVIGPIWANYLFQLKPSYPYLYGGALACIPAVIAWVILKPPVKENPNFGEQPA